MMLDNMLINILCRHDIQNYKLINTQIKCKYQCQSIIDVNSSLDIKCDHSNILILSFFVATWNINTKG